MNYDASKPLTHEEAIRILESGDARALTDAIVALSLYDTDCERTNAFCLRCATHSDKYVRGAAMIAFDHLSRRFRAFFTGTTGDAASALKTGLADVEDWVRGHADDSLDAFEHQTGRRIR